MSPMRPRGFVLVIAALLAALVLGSLIATAASFAAVPGREEATERALAQAKAALLAYAADRALDRDVGPGFLPCPDRDGDGWAEPTCGSLSGEVGQAQRLGLLPWKTLGLPELRDGHGERLWYAVSTRHKGLLNCAASERCIDLTPASALGTVTVRDASGALLHDGRVEAAAQAERSGAAAVVIAPGAPLTRADGREQRRGCAAAACAPADFLDVLPGVDDNARFVDRMEPANRDGNLDGFVAGPATQAGRVVVNDRLAIVGHDDLVPRAMARVALEAAHCLRLEAALAGGRLPAPLPACAAATGHEGFGRLPDIDVEGCNLGPAAGPGWWRHWRDHVLYAPAPSCASGGPCLELVDAAGATLARRQRLAIAVRAAPGDCGPGPLRCAAGACVRAVAREGRDVALAFP